MKKVRVFVTLDISVSAVVNLEIGEDRLRDGRVNWGLEGDALLLHAALEVINEGTGDIWGSIQPEDDVTNVHHFGVDVALADD